MAGFQSRLFIRIIGRNREVYFLKIATLAIAFASSTLITFFSLNEFGFDRLHKNPDTVFRVLERNNDESYSGNRLSVKIPPPVINRLETRFSDSLIISRVKILNDLRVVSPGEVFRGQKVHAADSTILDILSFEFIDGNASLFSSRYPLTALLSSRAAEKYMGTLKASGRRIKLCSTTDTVEMHIAGVFRNFPENSHEDFDVFIQYHNQAITSLGFDPVETGVYGRVTRGLPQDISPGVAHISMTENMSYRLQPLTDVYFGPRALGEEARHGDAYSVTILICIAGLILFLALSSYINLTTLTLPHRSKEFAVKKLAGIGPRTLLYSFVRESFALVGLSLSIGILILVLSSGLTETLLGLRILPLLLKGDTRLLLVISLLFLVVSLSPVLMVLRFIKATPNRLLSTETISFPGIKHTIAFLQLGISIFLIIASVVVRRQINYSLLKEPGRNHDQVVYLNCPSGITNEGIRALRSGWQKYNPNILDVMAVSQLPDRLSSKEVGTDFYSLQVDRGFLDFFGLRMEEGNWFRVNAGDSIVVTNKKGKRMMGDDTTNLIGVVGDLSGRFNQGEKPVKIRLARDFNYNWLCVRVLEVDIRRTVAYLSKQFSTEKEKSVVHFLNKRFEDWLAYQDRLNVLSGILAVISALLSCCAIYGLSVSLVRDNLKQIAVRKLLGARTFHITGLLMIDFGKQMLLALIVFAPVTYIFLNELLRTFVYATKFQWLDPVYPIAYCALVITSLCGFQAFSLNRADLTSALKS